MLVPRILLFFFPTPFPSWLCFPSFFIKVVVGHSEEVQIRARDFGRSLAFAQQIKSEIDNFSHEQHKDSFPLLCAPVVFHVREEEQRRREEASASSSSSSSFRDRTAMFDAVKSGPGMQLARELGHFHRREALAKLEHLPESESKAALTNIVNSISCVA